MSYKTVTPAYGRDYRSMKAARDDWNNDLDFIAQPEGKYLNKSQADMYGFTVHIRYAKMRKVCTAKA